MFKEVNSSAYTVSFGIVVLAAAVYAKYFFEKVEHYRSWLAPIVLFVVIGIGAVMVGVMLKKKKRIASAIGVLGWIGSLAVLGTALVSQW